MLTEQLFRTLGVAISLPGLAVDPGMGVSFSRRIKLAVPGMEKSWMGSSDLGL